MTRRCLGMWSLRSLEEGQEAQEKDCAGHAGLGADGVPMAAETKG